MNDESKALLEANSPSVMKKVGELLPPRGIELVYGQSLVTKILSKVSALFPVLFTNICFTAICAGRIILGLRQMD